MRNRLSLGAQIREQSTSDSSASQDRGENSDPASCLEPTPFPDEIVHPIITATQDGPSSEVSQLYYGACSHFSSLQQIHRTATTNSDVATFSPGPCHEWQEGLDIYEHCELFFGSKRNCNTTKSRGDAELAFLPYDLAQRFLKCYLGGIHQVFPFRSSTNFEKMLDGLYGRPLDRKLEMPDRIIVLVVLAIGATSTENSYWAEALYRRSQLDSDLRSDVANISTVQTQLLLICIPLEARSMCLINTQRTVIIKLSRVDQICLISN